MVYVVAEIGVNHNGNLATAEKMIYRAKECSADAVKFQAFCASELEPPGERRDMLSSLELGEEALIECKKEADRVGIDFICTPFAPHWCQFLAELGCWQIKISSGSLKDVELLKAAAETGCNIILSTGMADLHDIWSALRDMGWPENVTLLHCTSAYPTKPEDVNILAIPTMREAFHLPIGFSDHTIGPRAAVQAVTLKAVMVEKHFTLDSSDRGPDHHMSTMPDDFKFMVQEIRAAEESMGSGVKAARLCEDPVKKVVAERLAWANDPVEKYKNASQGE